MNLLGIDVGTTSLKAVFFDDKLNEKKCVTLDYTLDAHGDIAEFEPEDYWRLTKKAIDEICAEYDVYSLAIDTQCETIIFSDENGSPTRPAIVWVDNRAGEEAEEIEKLFGRKTVYEITGQPEITAAWPACKIKWVQKNEPDVWKKTKKIFLLEDYLLYKLTGEFVTEKTLQSSSLYFDIRKGEWWQEMLGYLGVTESMLPKLLDSAVPVGEYCGIKVNTGAMDQVSGAVGAGIIKEGIISEMTGTTMVLFVPSEKIPLYNQESIIPCHYNYNGRYSMILWTSVAGMALKWFKQNFCENLDFAELDVLAEKIAPGSDCLTMLPHLYGSTMPKYNPDARGCFYGLTLEHTKAHFIRCIMESVSCMLKSNLDYLNMDIKEIRCMGGGAKSDLWCRIKADMTGKTLYTLKNKETACLGAAIFAGVGCGLFESVEKACEGIKTDKVYKSTGIDYSETYNRYIKLDNVLNNKEEFKW